MNELRCGVALLLLACAHGTSRPEHASDASEDTSGAAHRAGNVPLESGLSTTGGMTADAAGVWANAQHAMGGAAALEALHTIEADAAITMPDAEGRLRVVSHADGRLHFDQQLSDGGRNRVDVVREGTKDFRLVDGERVELDARLRSFLRGHEFHLLVLAPALRLSGGELRPDERFDGRSCRVIQFLDEWGQPVDFFIDAKAHLPAGFRMIEPASEDGATITVTLDRWKPHGEVQLFETLTVVHRGDTFSYVYETLRTE